jgi:uncharacterized protein (DUF433 family)
MKTLEETLTVQAPPLESTEGGAVWRIAGTRIPLDTVVNGYLDGATAEEIAQAYPTLRLADVYAVIAHYLQNREAVEQYLAERRSAAQAVRHQVESRLAETGLRRRLLTRLNRQGA